MVSVRRAVKVRSHISNPRSPLLELLLPFPFSVKMLFKTLVVSLLAAAAIAAPYPAENAVEAVEAQEQLPSLGGLGGLKMPVRGSLATFEKHCSSFNRVVRVAWVV